MLKTVLVVLSFAAICITSQVPLALNDSTGDQPVNGFKRLITPGLSTYAKQLIAVSNTPGLSLGVIQFDRFKKNVQTEFGAWGNRSEDGDKTTQDTLFDIGSCSKAFLAAAMGILMDDFAQGKNVTPLPAGLSSFTWKTKVQDLFPGEDSEWQLSDHWASEKANIIDILSHVSGLPSHDLSYGPSDTPASIVKKLRHLKPEFELREQWSYNNQMYIVGTHIISAYSRKPFTRFVKERIFVPLGMTSTTYSGKEAALSGNFSQTFTMHENTIRRIPFLAEGEPVSELIAGPGGIISSTIDILKWLGMLLNEGVDPITGVRIIPVSAFTEMTTAHAILIGSPASIGASIVGYGLGWWSASFFGHPILQHSGGLPGFLTLITLLPKDGVGIVSFVNQAAPLPNSMITASIIFDVLGIELQSDVAPLLGDLFDYQWPAIQGVRPAAHRHPRQFCATTEPTELPLELYAGTYSNPGFGNFTICTPEATSEYCKVTLSDFRKVYPGGPPSSTRALYGTWPRIWVSHVMFTPIRDNTFVFSPVSLYPDGYGKDTSPFSDSVFAFNARAEFDVKDGEVKGVGVFYSEDISRPFPPGPPPPTSGDLQEIADVYFVKED